MNHRSPEFIALSRKTVKLLKDKLSIPKEYTVFFTSSATECWEIIAQSLIRTKSIHIHNGAFGQKWFDYTHRLKPGAQSVSFEIEKELQPKELNFNEGEIICLTQNETSNGTQVSNKIIAAIKKNNPGHLIAVDATSSMAGVSLDFMAADIWFASVQKCFGLPAGLGVMACSPRAIIRMEEIGDRTRYNSLPLMKEMMDKWQTTYTPNVLGIFLLRCSAKKMNKIAKVDRTITGRQKEWFNFFRNSKDLQLLVKNSDVQSKTVITVKGSSNLIHAVKAAAKKKGLLLGEGYGDLKKETFRIANFPAIKKKEIRKLMEFLEVYKYSLQILALYCIAFIVPPW